jgi:hypothetical protein
LRSHTVDRSRVPRAGARPRPHSSVRRRCQRRAGAHQHRCPGCQRLVRSGPGLGPDPGVWWAARPFLHVPPSSPRSVPSCQRYLLTVAKGSLRARLRRACRSDRAPGPPSLRACWSNLQPSASSPARARPRAETRRRAKACHRTSASSAGMDR